jgi:mycothiol synthase
MTHDVWTPAPAQGRAAKRTNMMPPSYDIAPARADERSAALALALRHVPDAERSARVRHALTLLDVGDIDPLGIWVARTAAGLAGVQVCIPLRGGSGLFWLPQVESRWSESDLPERLVQAALTWLVQGGGKLAQALLPANDTSLAEPLVRCGFQHITQLQYMRHDLETIAGSEAPPMHLQNFAPAIERTFQDTLARTYQGTLDCPELNGLRTVEESMEGHRAQGIWRPENWRLAWLDDSPAGVVLMMELHDGAGWDLSYVGVVPELRGRGLGRALVLHALHSAREAGAGQLLLAVDQRNTIALPLYESLGFLATESRAVFLHLNMKSVNAGQGPRER